MNSNIILLTDSYKISHWRQYPPGTERIYSYFESRGGLFPETTFFGLQYFLLRYLAKPVLTSHLVEAEYRLTKHLGPGVFHRAGWEHIVKDHNGWLPLEIKAVPEGFTVPTRNVLMTVENTCPKCYWLTNFVETLLVETWYPTTVATLSRTCKLNIKKWYDLTADDYSGLDFGLHDFGFRGVSSPESAAIGGCAHLAAGFKGTDTLAALDCADLYYGDSEGVAGFSIPAAEHSTITSWGKERELDAYRNMLTQYPTGPVAVVSDSWDIFNAAGKLWGTELKDMVLGRQGRVVIRPDSGSPPEVVTRVAQILAEKFGYNVNSKGYKVLRPNVRIIQGDGVDLQMISLVYDALYREKFSAENVCFGMGGALLQKLHRDTCKFAFKAAAIQQNNIWSPVYKDPVTDPGKKSKAGRMKLVMTDFGKYETVACYEPGTDLLRTVFKDGVVQNMQTLEDIRKRTIV